MITDRRIIELYLPHYCAAQIMRNLEDEARGCGEAYDADAIGGWRITILASLVAAVNAKDNRRSGKIGARLIRAADIMNSETYERDCGLAMVASTHLMQALIDADVWEPDEAFCTAWDKLGEATYNRCGNGARLIEADAEGRAVAARALQRLQHEGYYHAAMMEAA